MASGYSGGSQNINPFVAAAQDFRDDVWSLVNMGWNYNQSARAFRRQKDLMSYAYELNRLNTDYQNAWNERMANTAHQREVADLRAAGLNPILTATGGSGSAIPVGGSSSVGAGSVSAENDNFAHQSRFFENLMLGKQTEAAVTTAKKQQDNLDADTYLKGNQADLTSEQFNNMIWQSKKLEQDIKNSVITTAAQNYMMRSQGQAALMQGAAAYKNSITNSLVGDSQIDLNSAKAEYERNHSTGYTSNFGLNVGPVGFNFSHTGDRLFNNRDWRTEYENINGKYVPVRTHN